MAYSWQSDIIRPDGENGTEVLDTNGVYQPQIEGGDNITIEDGKINASGTLENVQADYTETDTSAPSYIKHKPDLSIYATASGMETELAGKQNVISDLETIRSGAASGSTAVQPGDLAAVATTGSYTSLSNTPQNIVQDASYVHTDNNFSNADKSKLDGIATGAEVNVQPDWNETDSSSDAYIANKPTIPAAQVNSDWNASSGVAQILNKPDLSAYATDSELAEGLATKQNVISDLDTIRAGAAAGATAAQPSDLPSSDELVPSASSGDAGKVLTVDAQGEPSWQTPASVTVDQTYNASSTHAQSGTAVAQAIASIPSSSYTAGDGIDITSSEISVNADDATLDFDPVTVQSTSSSSTWNNNSVSATTDVINALNSQTPVEVKIHLPARAVYWYNNLPSTATFRIAVTSNGAYSYVYDGAAVEMYEVSGTYINEAQDITVVGPATSWAISGGAGSWTGITGIMIDVVSGGRIYGSCETFYAGEVTYTVTRIDPNKTLLTVKNPLPSSTSSDANKVLTVDSNGAAGWQTPSTVTVDQTYNASSTNAQSGTAVAQAIASIPSSSYTAGDAIDITNNEISVDYDTDTLDTVYPKLTVNMAQSTSPGTLSIPSEIQALAAGSSPATVKIHVPANTLYLMGDWTANPLRIAFCASNYKKNDEEGDFAQFTSIAVSCTYESSDNNTWIDEQDIEITLPCNSLNGWSGSVTPVKFTISVDENDGNAYFGSLSIGNGTTLSNPVVFSYPNTSAAQVLAVKNPVPASTQVDYDKVLKVNAAGNAEWGWENEYAAGNMISIDLDDNNRISVSTLAGIANIQVVNSLPANPIPDFLYLIPEA